MWSFASVLIPAVINLQRRPRPTQFHLSSIQGTFSQPLTLSFFSLLCSQTAVIRWPRCSFVCFLRTRFLLSSLSPDRTAVRLGRVSSSFIYCFSLANDILNPKSGLTHRSVIKKALIKRYCEFIINEKKPEKGS